MSVSTRCVDRVILPWLLIQHIHHTACSWISLALKISNLKIVLKIVTGLTIPLMKQKHTKKTNNMAKEECIIKTQNILMIRTTMNASHSLSSRGCATSFSKHVRYFTYVKEVGHMLNHSIIIYSVTREAYAAHYVSGRLHCTLCVWKHAQHSMWLEACTAQYVAGSI